MIPPTITSPADDAEIPSWMETAIPAAPPPPPPPTRAELVRFDLADTARRLGLRGTARLVLVAATAEEWEDARLDLKGAKGWCRWDDRAMAGAASRAADLMGDGEVSGAAWELAEHRGESVATWESQVRSERAKDGAR